MTIKIATWNLNTWLNRRDHGRTNTELWHWADENIGADVVVFTEAETPPPRQVVNGRWSTAHRPQGFPGVSRWGTVIAARNRAGVRVEHITSVGSKNPHLLDTKFPGTFTAADLIIGDRPAATIIGLHLRYRKDKDGRFKGHPENDLDALKKDFEAVVGDRRLPLIITGDFNFEMEEMPSVLKRLCKGDLGLVDAFATCEQATFEQAWEERNWFRIDYMFLSKSLDDKVVARRGGNIEFASALEVSDHSPLLVEVDLS